MRSTVLLLAFTVASGVLAAPYENEDSKMLEKRFAFLPLLGAATSLFSGGKKAKEIPTTEIPKNPEAAFNPNACFVNQAIGATATRTECERCCNVQAPTYMGILDKCERNCGMLPAIISNALPGTVVDSSVTGQAASGNQIAQLGYVSQQQPPQELAYRSGHPFLSAYVDPRKPAQDPSQVSPNYDYSLGSGTTSSSGRSTSRSRNSGSQYTDIYGQTSDQSYQQYPYSQNTARSQYSDDQDSGSQTSNSLSRNPSSSNYRYSQNGQKSNDASGRSSQLSGQNGEQFASGDLAPYPSSLSSQDGTQNLQNVAYRPSQSETTNRQQANSGSQDPNYQVTPSMDGSSQTNPSDYQLNREEAPYNPTSGTLQDPGQAFDASTPSVVALPPATPLNGTAYGGSSDASYGGYPGAPLDPTRTRPLSRNEASAALNAAAERSAAAVAAAVQNSVSASQAASSAAAAAAAAQSLAAAQAAAAAADQASDVEMAQMNSCAEKRNRKDKKLKFDTKGCRQCCEDIKYLPARPNGIVRDANSCYTICAVRLSQLGG